MSKSIQEESRKKSFRCQKYISQFLGYFENFLVAPYAPLLRILLFIPTESPSDNVKAKFEVWSFL